MINEQTDYVGAHYFWYINWLAATKSKEQLRIQ